MKKILYTLLFSTLLLTAPGCSKEESGPNCGTHNGHQLHQGPQGGCYYINSSGNQEYVARNLCNC